MTTRVHIEYDCRARRFGFACTCGWRGDTASLYRVAAAFEEHLRGCNGEPPFSSKPYRPERYDVPATSPKPRTAKDN